jgi:RluA family pseudouridine synthase
MIDILFEHAWFLVINKPFGILTQAVPGIESVQTLLTKQLQDRNPEGPVPFIGMPHRLDRVTTGAMVVARNQRALRRLCDQFAARKVSKAYCALVPRMDSAAGTWVDHIRKIPDQPKAEVVASDSKDAKQAVLHYREVAACQVECDQQKVNVSLVEVMLETGRMHQIRLQFSHHGFPILGDRLYGSTWGWRVASEFKDCSEREPPIALHSQRLEFRHPQTAEHLKFEAPLPVGWPSLT